VLGPKVRRAHASDRVLLRGAEISVKRFPAELNPRPLTVASGRVARDDQAARGGGE
jgi:hypothetical protein